MDEQQRATLEHITDEHEFPADLCRSNAEPYLDLLHCALHDQRSDHRHRWLVVQIDNGAPVSPPLDSEKLARRCALHEYGPEAGKEYDVVRHVPCSLPAARDVFLFAVDAPFGLQSQEVAELAGLRVDEVFAILSRLQVLGLVSGDVVNRDQLTWSSNLHESASRREAEELFDRAWAVWEA